MKCLPLAGDTIDLGFDLAADTKGFVNDGTQTTVIDNGTYFTKRDFFPVIGYDAHRQLDDSDERRKRGLELVIHFAKRDDMAARQNTPRASDADRVVRAWSGRLRRTIGWTSGDR